MTEKLWWLRDHQAPGGRREVRKHYERASDDLQAAFDVHWEFLSVRPREQWVRPAAHKLRPEHKNAYRDFFEFRFKAENTEQRPLGYFGPSARRFTLLIWAIEKGSKFVPPDAVQTCEKRREAIDAGVASAVVWDKDENDENDTARKASPQTVPGRLR